MTTMTLNPVGYVEAPSQVDSKLIYGQPSIIHILPQYADAMLHLSKSEYIWTLCWLHKSDRTLLQVRSRAASSDTGLHGVFSLRSPVRPNPVSMTLVRLISVDRCKLSVDGLDVYDGTPVIDIKPYIYEDSVFSPNLFTLKPRSPEMREATLTAQAFKHHQERCSELALTVRMALLAESMLKKPVTDNSVCIEAAGSLCFADCLQGITRARLAHPTRFSYTPAEVCTCIWSDSSMSFRTEVTEKYRTGCNYEIIMSADINELCNVVMY